MFNKREGFLRLLPGSKVLVFGNAGVRYSFVGVVHDSNPLVFSAGVYNAVPFQGAIGEASKCVIEISIGRTRIEYMIEILVALGGIRRSQRDGDSGVIQYIRDDGRISLDGHPLKACIVEAIIVGESNW